MQVNSLSSRNVEPKQTFGRRLSREDRAAMEREALEQFANLNDRQLQQLAYMKASYNVNDKKHKRISNALYYSIPLAAGLAAAIRTPAKTLSAKGLVNSSRALRLGNFAASALSWAGTFAAIDLIFGGKRQLDKSSPAVREFSEKHPIISTIATIGASIGAIFLAGKGISKLAKKVLPKASGTLSKTFSTKELRAVAKVSDKLNNSKILNWASEKLTKVPSAIKNFAKGVIDYGPILLICSSIAHSFNHQNVKAKEVVMSYEQIKDAQDQVRTALANAEDSEYPEIEVTAFNPDKND